MTRCTALAIGLISTAWIAATLPVPARAGLAEWEVPTTGGHLISHLDPWVEQHGTCLRGTRGERVFVAHLEWWQQYSGAVIGKARNGYFLFAEFTERLEWFRNEQGLRAAIEQRRLGAPQSDQLTPADGWDLTVGAAIRQQCERMVPGSAPFEQLDPAMRESILAYCARMRATTR
jgi:hypothetical protein